MKPKETFNLNPDLYDELRPTYSKDLYHDIFKYANLEKNCDLIEIGIGTGQATAPFLNRGCNITAIEIGSNLANFTAEKYRGWSNLKIVNSDFESYDMNDFNIDMFYSASAFHWINPEIGLPKIYKALKHHGVFAWISTTPCAWKDNEELFNLLQEVYIGFKDYFAATSKLTISQVDKKIEADIKYKKSILETYNFRDINSYTYTLKKTFTSEDYIRLLDTYSDHAVIPKKNKAIFYSKIKSLIDKQGGMIPIVYTNVLVVGRKKLL
ncbi:hypothetical protein BK011_05850 [Tenericutes bacterium MZ-XQ]|jgi:ubiquinone/menaquinone biosynthesis C-methylase UbiE|nr:hypothetical protein BK011_05850 [Tenericutes bacterium MZ-XQ]